MCILWSSPAAARQTAGSRAQPASGSLSTRPIGVRGRRARSFLPIDQVLPVANRLLMLAGPGHQPMAMQNRFWFRYGTATAAAVLVFGLLYLLLRRPHLYGDLRAGHRIRGVCRGARPCDV